MRAKNTNLRMGDTFAVSGTDRHASLLYSFSEAKEPGASHENESKRHGFESGFRLPRREAGPGPAGGWAAAEKPRSWRIHADRIAGGHCHHRHIGGDAAARPRQRQGTRATHQVPEQFAPASHRHDGLRPRQPGLRHTRQTLR